MALFGWSRRSERQDALENVIGPSTSLRGHIKSDGGARIDGRFEGRIEVAGNVVVTERGCVVGDILARDVTIGGTVEGNIEGAGRLEILSTGKLFGDVVATAILIDDGGVFEGISRMRGAARPALPPPVDVVPALEEVVIDLDRRPEARSAQPAPRTESTLIVDAPADTVRDGAKKGPQAIAEAAKKAAQTLGTAQSTEEEEPTPRASAPDTPSPEPATARQRSETPMAETPDDAPEPVASNAPEPTTREATPAPAKGSDTVTISGKATQSGSTPQSGSPRVSKVAARLAAENGLDTAAIRGTGHRGMVTKADVRRELTQKRRAAAAEKGTITQNKGPSDEGSPEQDPTSDPNPRKAAPTPIVAETVAKGESSPGVLDLSDLNIEPVIPDTPQRATADAAQKPSAPTSSSAPTSKRAGTRRSSRGRKRRR